MHDPTRGLGSEYHASQCQRPSHRRVESSSLSQSWAACITTTSGAQLRDHHMPELLDGWEYSARTPHTNCIDSKIAPSRTAKEASRSAPFQYHARPRRGTASASPHAINPRRIIHRWNG